jgi:hypothetical protein
MLNRAGSAADPNLGLEAAFHIACQQQLAPVSRWQMNIDHLERGELLENAVCGQSRRQCIQSALQMSRGTLRLRK